MNKKWFLPLAVLLCCAAIGSSLAFRNASITAYNVITFGNVKLKLHETFLDENGREQAVDLERRVNITSAAYQSRRFYVENTGKNSLYTRLCFDIQGKTMGGQKFSAKEYLKIQGKQETWIFQDGWYYCTVAVEPGQRTAPLEMEIEFLVEELTKAYPGSQFHLRIHAQGIQSQNNEENVLKITGWPKEEAI